MKKTIATLTLLFITFSNTAYAERLLRCNTPMGSSLQEIEIYQEDGKIYLRELNMSGSSSAPKLIRTAAWDKKDIKWTSKNEGSVHIQLVKEDGAFYWLYKAVNIGTEINGYCEE